MKPTTFFMTTCINSLSHKPQGKKEFTVEFSISLTYIYISYKLSILCKDMPVEGTMIFKSLSVELILNIHKTSETIMIF